MIVSPLATTCPRSGENPSGVAKRECLDVLDPRSAGGGTWRVRVTQEALALEITWREEAQGCGASRAQVQGGVALSSFAGARYAVVPWGTDTEPSAGAQAPAHVRVPLDSPLRCEPREVPKPWGKEIWFTGFEARGVCAAGGVPFPVLLAAGREAVFGEGVDELLLLKILDPLPEPVRGDLYTEVHAEKNEVYVCTHAPDSGGWLRYGIHPVAWEEAGRDADTYKARYLAAVRAYEVVRRRIDAALDAWRAAHPDATEPPPLPSPHDRAEEERLRARMNAFTALHPMRRGSVARVPVGVPHALQAGCRVVEFQTATYERAILSFAQKVLTQDSWDTERALALLDVDEALRTPLLAESERGEERIVDFPAFEAWRLRLSPGQTRDVGNPHTYELLYVVEREEAPVDGLTEGAWFVPRGARVTLNGAGLVLRAFPRRPKVT